MLGIVRRLASSGPSGTEREALRVAIAAKAEAEQALAAAKERTQRVQAVVDSADDAELAAKRAERAATDASRQWAAFGATAGHREHHEAIDSAREAQSAAEQAKIEAKGAGEAIGALRSAQAEAEYTLERAKHEVEKQAAEVVFASAGPLLDRLQRVADAVPGMLSDVAQLRSLQGMLARCSSHSERCHPLLNEIRKLDGAVSAYLDGPCVWVDLVAKLQRDADADASLEDA